MDPFLYDQSEIQREKNRQYQLKWRESHIDVARERARAYAKAHYERTKEHKIQQVKERR
jgi:hypothetical protein